MEFDPHAGDALNTHHDINFSENEAELFRRTEPGDYISMSY
jgi:hypothetical protein